MMPRDPVSGCLPVFAVMGCLVICLLVGLSLYAGASGGGYEWLSPRIAQSIAGRNEAETDRYRRYTEIDIQREQIQLERDQMALQNERENYLWEKSERQRIQDERSNQAAYNAALRQTTLSMISGIGTATESSVHQWGGVALVALAALVVLVLIGLMIFVFVPLATAPVVDEWDPTPVPPAPPAPPAAGPSIHSYPPLLKPTPQLKPVPHRAGSNGHIPSRPLATPPFTRTNGRNHHD